MKKALKYIAYALVILFIYLGVSYWRTPGEVQEDIPDISSLSKPAELPINTNAAIEPEETLSEPGDTPAPEISTIVEDLPPEKENDAAVSGPTPTEEVSDPAPGVTPEESQKLRLVSQGSFSSRNSYTVSGTASVISENDQTSVIFENFSSTPGPDLRVWLTVDGETQDIGVLKGTSGQFSYAVPSNIDPDSISAVTVRCRAFFRDFGVADLN